MFTTTRRTAAIAAFALGVIGIATPALANTDQPADAEGIAVVTVTDSALPDAEGMSAIGPFGAPAN